MNSQQEIQENVVVAEGSNEPVCDGDILQLSDPVEKELQAEMETERPEGAEREERSGPEPSNVVSLTKPDVKAQWNLEPLKQDFAALGGKAAPWTKPVSWTEELASALPSSECRSSSPEGPETPLKISQVWDKAFAKITTLKPGHQKQIWANYSKLVAGTSLSPFTIPANPNLARGSKAKSGSSPSSAPTSGTEVPRSSSSSKTSKRTPVAAPSSSAKSKTDNKLSKSGSKSASRADRKSSSKSSSKSSASAPAKSASRPSKSSSTSSKEASGPARLRAEVSSAGRGTGSSGRTPQRSVKFKQEKSEGKKASKKAADKGRHATESAAERMSSRSSRSSRASSRDSGLKGLSVRPPNGAKKSPEFDGKRSQRSVTRTGEKSKASAPKHRLPTQPKHPSADGSTSKAVNKKKSSKSPSAVPRRIELHRPIQVTVKAEPDADPEVSVVKRTSVHERLGPSWFGKELQLPTRGKVPQDELMRLNESELTGSLRTRRRRQTKTRKFLREQGVEEEELYFCYEWRTGGSRKRAASDTMGESGKKKKGCVDNEAEDSDDDAME